ncbi:hypothetical protein [Streptomyces lanatus]|uniref:Secreted protein n=1 Tax=Streptomyces lanatus TaxID=66900 RepID=A0ABV1Y044_9ACTN|nr:hypothetical protein [Streptomyces lanatus]
MKHTAVVAAVVAAGGLAVTAWGTMKSAQVADDQLAQSEAQKDDAARKLTSRVTMWEERQSGWNGPPHRIVANRNVEPVYVFYKISAAELHRSGTGDRWVHPHMGMVPLGTIPPCTRQDFSWKAISYQVDARWNIGFWEVTSLVVVEPSGVQWQRLPGGEIKGLTKSDRRDLALARKNSYVPLPVDHGKPNTSDLEQCGSVD